MRLYIVSLVWTVLLCIGCTNSYPGLLFDYPENETDMNSEVVGKNPIQVSLDLQNTFYATSATTRGVGIMDYTDSTVFQNNYLKSKFYVLSYRKTVYSLGELSEHANLSLLLNSAGNDYQKDCLVSTELSESQIGQTGHRGKVGIPASMDGYLTFRGDEDDTAISDLYYSTEYPMVGYNFFAYYTDDAQINSTTADNDKTLYHLTIDGTQDIMVGSAPRLTRTLLKEVMPSQMDTATVDKILYYGDGGYSNFSAQCGVHPRVDIKHQLAALKMRVIQKDEDAEISIKSIRVKFRKEGDLVVAASNKDSIGYTSTGDPDWVDVKDVEMDLEYNKTFDLGPAMLVPEDYSYEVEINYIQHNVKIKTDGTTTDVERSGVVTLTLSDNALFEKGNRYFITFNIYDATEIIVTASASPWLDGGEVSIGDD